MNSQVKALMGKLKENTNLLIGELCAIFLQLFPGSLIFTKFNFTFDRKSFSFSEKKI
jgi:hypothetical protein